MTEAVTKNYFEGCFPVPFPLFLFPPSSLFSLFFPFRTGPFNSDKGVGGAMLA